MKSERRHELQTNVLADWLGKQIEQLKPRANVILWSLVGVVALMLLGSWLAYQQRESQAASWRDYYQVYATQNPDTLKNLAGDHPGSPAGLWALQTAADLDYSSGVRELFLDRERAVERLDDAKEGYRKVLDSLDNQPARLGVLRFFRVIPPFEESMLRERAQFGLAQAQEALSEKESAKTRYQELIDSSSNEQLTKLATERLAALDKSSKFYEALANFKPLPRTTPDAGAGGGAANLDNLPDFSDFPLPSGTSGDTSGGGTEDGGPQPPGN